MKLPNGYGSVHKLPGKRRNPYRARITNGWAYIDMDTGEEVEITENTDLSKIKPRQKYKLIGYFPTRAAGLQALAEYHKDPFDLQLENLTFAEVYERWSEEHYPTLEDAHAYKAAYKVLKPLYKFKLRDIKYPHLEKVLKESGKNKPTLKTVKILLTQLYKYGARYDIVTVKEMEKISLLDIRKAGNPDQRPHIPFTEADINKIWNCVNEDIYITIVLILIYSGVRISELLDLKTEDVHINERYFFVRKSKTESGIRNVPIADKVMPFWKKWAEIDSEYFFCTPDKQKLTYANYRDSYWDPEMVKMGFGVFIPQATPQAPKKKPLYKGRTCHDTRHTCVSLLTNAGVDARVIKKIVGHKGKDVTEGTYTQLEIAWKLEAINKI